MSQPLAMADEPTMEELELELSDLMADGELDLPPIPSPEPHQELIDSMCQMRMETGKTEVTV